MKCFTLLAEKIGLSISYGPVSRAYLVEQINPMPHTDPLLAACRNLDEAIAFVVGQNCAAFPGERIAFSLMTNPYHCHGSKLFMAVVTGDMEKAR